MHKSILNPDADVKLSTGTVTVKELSWKRALIFNGMLEEQVKGLIGEDGKFKFDAATIFAAVKGNAPLMEWIALECSNIEFKTEADQQAWLEKLSLSDMAKLVTKALEVNLRAVADEIKNVKSRLDALAAAGAQNNRLNPTSPNSAM